MALKFANFIQLNEGSSDYGITHVEDLDVEAFIRAIERIHELSAVQKLDGANLRAGLDERGELYASREQKGGKRFYKQADFPKTSAFDGFRAAFEVLKQNEDIVKRILSPGEAMNLEVIYGEQPNTVFYGKDNLNYLAILEMVIGDDPAIDPDQDKVKMLVKEFKNRGTIHIQTMASDTVDGKTMARAPKTTDWQITKSDPVVGHDKLSFGKELGALKKYLNEANKVANKAGKDLSNFEVLKDRSQDLAEERQRIEEYIKTEFKLPIKSQLLKLVYKQKPSLRGAVGDQGAYDGIEGVIFTDPKTREKFKVVDREVFTRINQFNYQVRKGIATRTITTNPEMPKEQRGGIVGEARLRAINMFGLSNAELPNQAKKVLANFKGSDRSETVKNIVKSLHQLNFEAVKRKIQSIYVSALDDLDEALDAFKTGADEYVLELENGKKIKYTQEIKRRTLMTFAEAHKTIIEMLARLRKAGDMAQLIEIFFGKQLDDLHGGSSV